jgi:hypothetical protein
MVLQKRQPGQLDKLPAYVIFPLQVAGLFNKSPLTETECGRSSGVEHNLAKVRVVSSNLIARSSLVAQSKRV